MSSFDPIQFRRDLLAWYQRAFRPLPWRETRDPYCILVSELMCQQTQVKTAIPYYHRFLELFPTARDLAAAPEEAVLKAWEGLGYYRRARHLQEAARQIVRDHGGVFPGSKEGIDGLKGVGAYTSAAVASIAFQLPHACVDGNVIRVVTRLRGMDGDVSTAAVKKLIQSYADEMLDAHQPGDFNQGMMELGATVCSPREPSCMTCPVRAHCATNAAGVDPHSRPVKTRKTRVSKADFHGMFLLCGDRFMMCRRPPDGLMADMWEPPFQLEGDVVDWRELLDGAIERVGDMARPVAHKFSHLDTRWFVTCYQTDRQLTWRRAPTAYVETRWFRLKDLETVPHTRVLRKMLPQLKAFMEDSWHSETSTLPGL